jgi:abortive infection bacteriophage resistance protein
MYVCMYVCMHVCMHVNRVMNTELEIKHEFPTKVKEAHSVKIFRHIFLFVSQLEYRTHTSVA